MVTTQLFGLPNLAVGTEENWQRMLEKTPQMLVVSGCIVQTRTSMKINFLFAKMKILGFSDVQKVIYEIECIGWIDCIIFYLHVVFATTWRNDTQFF